MYDLSQYAFIATIFALSLAVLLYFINAIGARGLRMLSFAGGGASSTSTLDTAVAVGGRYATILTVNAAAFLTASLVFRAIASGHGPFSNIYYFSLAFSWGALVLYLYFQVR